jgi:hypothetical protein
MKDATRGNSLLIFLCLATGNNRASKATKRRGANAYQTTNRVAETQAVAKLGPDRLVLDRHRKNRDR